KTKVLDTRKTTPGMRVLDKLAVKIGGGENHRIGLFDMILLKDNHIDFAGGVPQALTKCREYLARTGRNLKIEIEVRTLENIDEVFAAGGADRIMLDNFSLEMTREAVKRIAGRCEIESSGGITLETLRDYAECGVDFVSVGALTHQIKSLDMSLKAC
ncbi:MAG: nicotinate-nucleotide diphosphorylase (carboxylating), partial [Rikenellaceae bacterium]|nr:nicotinate-nucleotide diphosphorylase (carboxylating) [Rikenellaceae bacterium]